MIEPRLPMPGEATGFGASYIREDDEWVIYWLPGTVPLGVVVAGFDRRDQVEFVLAALRQTVDDEKEPSPPDPNNP